MTTRWCSLLFVLLALVPREARAEDVEESNRRFNLGREHVKARRCDLAVDDFRASFAASASVGALLNLGECLERLGKLDEAYTAFRDAQALSADRRDDDRTAFARAAAERIAARALRVAIVAEGRIEALTIDGEAVPRERWANVILSPNAVHRIVATATGRAAVTREVGGRPGERIEIEIAAGPSADPAAPPPSPPPPPREEPRGGPGPVRIAGIVTAGVGLAAAGAGVVLGLVAAGARDDLASAIDARRGSGCRGAYPDAVCDPSVTREIQPLVDDAKSAAALSTVAIGAGIALLATGIVLFFAGGATTSVSRRASPGLLAGRW